ncbi:MAG: hypothetical protein V6Z86_02460 [Hyphomicrobiales bacterium]
MPSILKARAPDEAPRPHWDRAVAALYASGREVDARDNSDDRTVHARNGSAIDSADGGASFHQGLLAFKICNTV